MNVFEIHNISILISYLTEFETSPFMKVLLSTDVYEQYQDVES